VIEAGGPGPLPGGAVVVAIRFLLALPLWVQLAGVGLAAFAVVTVGRLLWRRRRGLAAGFRQLPRTAHLALLAAALAGLVAVAAAGRAVHYFVEHDNAFCTSCHVMAEPYVRFTLSEHAELGCHACHQQPLSASLRQLYLWVIDRPEEIGPHAPVPDQRCTSCHVDGDPERWPQIALSQGHRAHLESDHEELREVLCVTCHGVEVHEFAPADATCGGCHEESQIQLGSMTGSTGLHCTVCHGFLAEEVAPPEGMPGGLRMVPARAECLACHEMAAMVAEQELMADPHGAVCGACHNPHAQDEPRQAVESCEGCHTDVETLTPFHASLHRELQAGCLTCHTAHSWKADAVDCRACHTPASLDRPGGLSDAGRRRAPRPRANGGGG
jgi:hypothetical protein